MRGAPSRIHFRSTPSPIDAGLFGGLDIDATTLVRVDWQNSAIHGDCGHFWVVTNTAGVMWVSDGMERIAAADPWRVVRYLKRSIATRCTKLLCDYLKDGLIAVPQGAVVINYGANIGEAAVALERRGASVLAIEPDPNVLPALRANACGRRIEVFPYVAWHTDGEVPLYLATKKGDTSVINPSDRCVSAAAKRLDTILREQSLEEVYLILGDAEGAEPEVLEGAVETLKITRYVSIRVSPERRGSSSAPQCMAILEAAGFDILSDDNETLIGRNRALACG